MFRTVIVKPNELGLRFREGHFIGPVGPGRHTLFVPPWDPASESLEVVDLGRRRFEHPRLSELIRDGELRDRLVVAVVDEGQQGRVWCGSRLLDTLGPGLHAYWQNPAEPIRVDVVANSEAGPWTLWGQSVPTRQTSDNRPTAAVLAAACA